MSIKIFLNRFCNSDVMGTFGKISIRYKEWYTIELPWKSNIVGMSCIPLGTFQVIPSIFKNKYPSYEILVPGRTGIKFHVANIINELNGCVGIGKGLGYYKGKWSVSESKEAFNEFMQEMSVIEANIRDTQIVISQEDVYND